jgi:hypothetical protein
VADNFTLDIQRFVDKAKGNIDLVVRRVSLDVFRRVILKSPVDTGRFKGNWQVGIGSYPTTTLNVLDKTGQVAINKAAGAAATLQAGQTIYLVNNLPYAIGLEFGKSKQAPAGMVRLTIAEFGGIVNRAASSVNP